MWGVKYFGSVLFTTGKKPPKWRLSLKDTTFAQDVENATNVDEGLTAGSDIVNLDLSIKLTTGLQYILDDIAGDGVDATTKTNVVDEAELRMISNHAGGAVDPPGITPLV